MLLFIEVTVRHSRMGTFGLGVEGGGVGDFLARKNYAIPEWVVVEIRM